MTLKDDGYFTSSPPWQGMRCFKAAEGARDGRLRHRGWTLVDSDGWRWAYEDANANHHIRVCRESVSLHHAAPMFRATVDWEQGSGGRSAYEEIRDLVTFGKRPVDGKVVVGPPQVLYGTHAHRIVSNPLGMRTELIALWCDCGNLPFGYRVQEDRIIVFTD